MATLKSGKEVPSDLLRLGSQEPLPRTVLAELQRLPSARCLPPFLRLKRRDSDAAPGGEPAAAPAAAPPPRPAPPAWSSRPVTLDPTGLLLVEAANQLQELVEQQAALRQLRRQRGGASYDSEPDESGSEGGWEGGSAPRSLGADSVSVASVSASGSCPASLESVGGTSLPLSRSLGRGSLAGHKRPHLERQYAIDLDGLCRVIGQRLPLPAPEEARG